MKREEKPHSRFGRARQSMNSAPQSGRKGRSASGGVDGYGMHRWAMPIAPIDVDLAKYAHVTIVSPIWVFALAAPMRACCGEAAGKIRTADYILVHHTRGQYENAAREMDALLGIHHTALRSVQCKVGRYREIPTNSRCGGSDQRL